VEEEIKRLGAEFAASSIQKGQERLPGLAIVTDVSMLEECGAGPISYTFSAGATFREIDIKKVGNILDQEGQRVLFREGYGNDAGSLAKHGIPVTTMQMHVDNMHSENEIAAISDVEEVVNAIEKIIKNHNQF
jgi:hypothetical protein